MKKGLSSLDVATLVAEFERVLVGARIEKAYQPAKDEILLRIRRSGLGKLDLIFKVGQYLTITRASPENPDKPSMVAKILRDQFGNGRIIGVSQVGFDRILRLEVERGDGARSIVFEIFGDGNMLLVENGTIFLPLKGEEHGARRLKKGEPYQPPPGGVQPFQLDLAGITDLAANAQRDLVRFLALDLGMGPRMAEELCVRIGVPKNTRMPEVNASALEAIHHELQAIHAAITKGDFSPAIVYQGEEPFDAFSFEMQSFPVETHPREEFEWFYEALDAIFRGGRAGEDDDRLEDPRQARFEDAKAKIQRQIDQMEESIEGFHALEEQARIRGDAIYGHFDQVGTITSTLQAGAEKLGWIEVANRIRSARAQGIEQGKEVIELDPSTSQGVLRLPWTDGDVDVPFDARDAPQDIAAKHYDQAKKEKSRQEGARKALVEAQKRMAELVAGGLEQFGKPPRKEEGPRRHFWFETYRYTVTPSGFIAVGGRNASQNDAVVKKYLRDGDRYVHAEVHGAPSVVLRHPVRTFEEGEPREEDLLVAGQFAAASSRAWRQFAQASAYWVTPQQVSKTPRSGEFVPRGAWIVHGKRNVMDRLPMEWGMALVRFDGQGNPTPEGRIEKWVGGPMAGLRALGERLLELKPGTVEPNDAATQLSRTLEISVEDVQAILPPGPVTLPESVA